MLKKLVVRPKHAGRNLVFHIYKCADWNQILIWQNQPTSKNKLVKLLHQGGQCLAKCQPIELLKQKKEWMIITYSSLTSLQCKISLSSFNIDFSLMFALANT